MKKEILVTAAVLAGAFILWTVYKREQAAQAASAAQQSQQNALAQDASSSAQYLQYATLPQLSLTTGTTAPTSQVPVSATSDAPAIDTSGADTLLANILANFAANVTPQQSTATQTTQALISALPVNTIPSVQTIAGLTQAGTANASYASPSAGVKQIPATLATVPATAPQTSAKPTVAPASAVVSPITATQTLLTSLAKTSQATASKVVSALIRPSSPNGQVRAASV